MKLGKYSFGAGDRFARQGEAQLSAFARAREELGVAVVPVWNKSAREHRIVGSRPAEVRAEAEAAVAALGWRGAYHVDADHIDLASVEPYLASCDFFTLDVAEVIGAPADEAELDAFLARARDLPLELDPRELRAIAARYLRACAEAARIYRAISAARGAGTFITEVSMDETDKPQGASELLVILAALALEEVPLQTIAPKFSGSFHKGVDYKGELELFAREFEEDLDALDLAVRELGLPAGLKLSIHSGSDKFSLYGPINAILRRRGAGLHLKTAGTTWLEELIGLAEAGGAGLAAAREIYAQAHARAAELCAPYAAVIAIDPTALPAPSEVTAWSGQDFAAALRHDPTCPAYNPSLRQLLHVGYAVAARMGQRYLDLLETCRESVARNVTANLYERHIEPLFAGL